MSRLAALVYATVCYALFLLVFLYAIGFVAGVGVPKGIDDGPHGALLPSLLIDAGLLLLFAAQHSVMARPAFKRWWTRFVPPVAERSTFVLASSLALALLFWQWRPLPAPAWDIDPPWLRGALHALSASGWLLVLSSTFLINHFELFGLRQAWRHGRPPLETLFVTRAFYRIVRHPLMLGFLVAFWAAPTMSTGHLLFALATTGYILFAVKCLEERDLVALYGDTYRDYQRRVPMLLPWPRRASRHPATSTAAPVHPRGVAS
jgi:methanethiol S-methyltransferase